MNEVEGPTWETANGFVARAGPLWHRQVVGGVLAFPFVLSGAGRLGECVHHVTMGSHHEALHALAISGPCIRGSQLRVSVEDSNPDAHEFRTSAKDAAHFDLVDNRNEPAAFVHSGGAIWKKGAVL